MGAASAESASQRLFYFTGTSFVSVTVTPELDHFPDMIKVISTQPDTHVSIPSQNSTLHIQNKGDHIDVELLQSDYSLYFFSDKPIKAFQITKSAKVRINTFPS